MATLKIIIKGKNLDITPALRAYAEKKIVKIEKFLSKHVEEPVAVLMLRTEKEIHIAELTIEVNGLVMRGEGRTDDMYVSIDESVDKIERQWNKFKTKIQKKIQGPKIGTVVAPVPEISKEDEPDSDQFKIVRIKRFDYKPMSVEEAIMQMELLGHNFFVFTSADDEQVNVVYKRREGNYGLIEPEF